MSGKLLQKTVTSKHSFKIRCINHPLYSLMDSYTQKHLQQLLFRQ